MKITGLVLLILGWLMVIFNTLGYIGAGGKFTPPPDAEGVSMVAFYIGTNLFFIVGAILMLIGYRLRKKSKMKKLKKDLLDNFLSDPPENAG